MIYLQKLACARPQSWLNLPFISSIHGIRAISCGRNQQEESSQSASQELQAQDIIVTGLLLAQVTVVSMGRALMFLRLHRTETPKAARARQRGRKLEEVCTRLEGQGVRVTSPRLSKEAGVMKKTAIDFLKARRSTSHAAN